MFSNAKNFLIRYIDPIFFVGGFIFDSIAIVRIDSRLDLSVQAFYLCMVTLIIILQVRVMNNRWTPSGWIGKAWHYETEALHFCYGGLLSSYVVLYFKSTSSLRSIVFLSLMVVLMFANEMPQVRRVGTYLRLGLHAFCVVSFLNYLLPIFIGRMGSGIFLLSWLLSVAISAAVVWCVAKETGEPAGSKFRLGWPPASVLSLILVLYFMKLIPPVPLSVQYMGIYHSVDRVGDRFKLGYEKPPWYHFWQKWEREFVSREGEPVICFVRVFAPTGFEHRIFFTWEKRDDVSHRWTVQDRIPNAIFGGRKDGFRGYSAKVNYMPGDWRVNVETEDGRLLSSRDFVLRVDPSAPARERQTLFM